MALASVLESSYGALSKLLPELNLSKMKCNFFVTLFREIIYNIGYISPNILNRDVTRLSNSLLYFAQRNRNQLLQKYHKSLNSILHYALYYFIKKDIKYRIMLKCNNTGRYDYSIVNIIKSFQNGKMSNVRNTVKAFNNWSKIRRVTVVLILDKFICLTRTFRRM